MMNRREFFATLSAGALFGAAGKPTNIILIVADDLGYGDLGCYGQGRIRTPHLDRLAAEGMRFTQAYAGSTVCAPSRCALMTGFHGGHGRVRDNLPHGVFLQPDDVTVAELLKEAGYRTAGFGKWSLGNPGTWGLPWMQGFDEWFGYLDQDHAQIYYPETIWENGEELLLFGNRGGKKTEYMPELCTQKALDFITRNRRQPFFAYVAYTLPHWSDYPKDSPLSQLVPSDKPYSGEPWPQVEKNYAAMVTLLDGYVGRILAHLQKTGIEENTLVIFTSDNGPSAESLHQPSFFRSAGPFRGTKRELYEGGIRIPFLVRQPGKISAGEVSEHICAFWDFLPTAAELAGVNASRGLDGISLVPALRGGKSRSHDYLYWDYGHVRDRFLQAVRWQDWKLVRNGVRSPVELYNLATDQGEANDVAGHNPEVVRKMTAMMEQAYRPSADYPVKELADVK
jgi:arylsulfatase A-like enzyme